MKTAIFIDGQNFWRSLTRNAADVRVDYNKLADYLVEEVHQGSQIVGDFVGAHYYVGLGQDAPITVLGFLNNLKLQKGYFVHTGPRSNRVMTCFKCGSANTFTVEKRIDTQLTADMIRLAAVGAYDVAILVSGDADFIPAIEAVAALGKQVWIATWSITELSMDLRRHCFSWISIQAGIEVFRAKSREAKILENIQLTKEPTSE